MALEIVHPNALIKILSTTKEVLSQECDMENLSVCYPWWLIEKWPAQVFSNITFLDCDNTSSQSLQDQGYTVICETINEHNCQYDLVLEMRSQLKPNEIMKLVKPGGFIFSEANYGVPNALEKSKDFVLVKNLTKNSVTPPKNLSVWPFWNWSTDFFSV